MTRSKTGFGTLSAPWLFVFIAVVIFFAGSTLLAYRSTQVMADNSQTVTNTLQVINLIKELQVELYAAESGQRGYVLTTDEQYLEPYYGAVDEIDQLLNGLGLTTTGSPTQQRRFEELSRLVLEKIDEMETTIGYVQSDKDHIALSVTNSNKGMELTRSIVALIQAMQRDEHQLLVENRRMAEQNQDFMLLALLATNIIGLCLAIVIYAVVFRSTRKVEGLNEQIERHNQALEKKIQERTEALSQYADELERSNRELQDFAFVASHDLQEPLRKIRAFGDRLQVKFGPQLGEQGLDYARRMYAASERMSVLIDDLLSFSRVTTRQKEFEEVDLNQLSERVLDDLEFAIESADAEVKVSDLPTIEADGSQLSQVFANLISNSLKFRTQERKSVIRVSCEVIDNDIDDRDWIRLKFADNGIGFDAQYKDRIFNLFQRLHGREEYSGTGIGLALCRKIVERHGGMIDVEAKLGEGATFIIDLPTTQVNLQDFSTDESSV